MSASDPRAPLIETSYPILLSSISNSLSVEREDPLTFHLQLMGKVKDALRQNLNPTENDSDMETDYSGNSEEDMKPENDISLIQYQCEAKREALAHRDSTKSKSKSKMGRIVISLLPMSAG